MDNLRHFDISRVWIMNQEKLEIAEDVIFICNNNYSEHSRHILQHTGVIWNFYGIFQQRISRSSIGLGQRDKNKRKEETDVILRNGFVLSCDFMYLVYVICLGRLFIGDWRRRHVGSKSYKEGGCKEKERG